MQIMMANDYHVFLNWMLRNKRASEKCNAIQILMTTTKRLRKLLIFSRVQAACTTDGVQKQALLFITIGLVNNLSIYLSVCLLRLLLNNIQIYYNLYGGKREARSMSTDSGNALDLWTGCIWHHSLGELRLKLTFKTVFAWSQLNLKFAKCQDLVADFCLNLNLIKTNFNTGVPGTKVIRRNKACTLIISHLISQRLKRPMKMLHAAQI